MASPEPILPETRTRWCPSCRSLRITPVGRVLGTTTEIWEQHVCKECGTAFWFVHKAPS